MGDFASTLFKGSSYVQMNLYILTLFGFISHLPSLGGPGWMRSPVDAGKMPVVPGSDPEDVPHGVGLLLSP